MPRRLRVLAVPSAHPYPARLRAADPDPPASGVVHLPDPPVPGAPEGQWWPPAALDPAWVRRHHRDVDVVHLHFGFDACAPADLEAWCTTLDQYAIPLVLTIHDLVNPHFVDQGAHLARLDVLVPRATTLVTLTEGAADQVVPRWGRRPVVLPHPHVAPIELVGTPPARPRDRFVVGLHLKGLRANVVTAPVVTALLDGLEPLPGAVLRVHLHHEVLDPAHPRHDRSLADRLTGLADEGRVELTVHDPHTDEELWAYLRGLDVSVLPYAFGTHSGWLEACHDLGTAVLAPRTGRWVEQQRCLTFGWPRGGRPDAREIAEALAEADATRPTWQASRPDRVRQRRELAAAHAAIYADAVGVTAEPA